MAAVIRTTLEGLMPALQRELKKGEVNTQKIVARKMGPEGQLVAKRAQLTAYFGSGLHVINDWLRGRAFAFSDGAGEFLRLGLRNEMVYSRIHEFGGYAGRGKKTFIPARPVFGPAIEKTGEKIGAEILREIGEHAFD